MAFDFPASPTEGQTFAPVGGPLYVYNAPAWKVAGITTIPGEWKMNEIVITTGTGPYIKPANLAYLEVTLIGGGGGGTNAGTTAAGQSSVGGGGGAGGVAVKLYAAADVPASVTYTVGAAGAAGGATGSAGTATVFDVMTAGGGSGGAASTAPGTTVGWSTGGGGGVSTGGTLNLPGRNGGDGIRAAHGTATVAIGGIGGGNMYAEEVGGTAISIGMPGPNGNFPGGGGGGGSRGASQTVVAGGAGGAGVIILREYFPAWVLNAAAAPGTITETIITASTTFPIPAGCKFIDMAGVGGGAGGGGIEITGTIGSGSGSGGGGGTFGRSGITSVGAATSIAVTIGPLGAGGAAGLSGTAGGPTQAVLNGVTYTWPGGNGGAGLAVGSVAFQGGFGGNTGTNLVGGGGSNNGEPGHVAYSQGSPTVPVAVGGAGGGSPYGRGGIGVRSTSGSLNTGMAGIGYGSGGGGASACNLGTVNGRVGGNGTPGLMVVTCYF